jgi:SRSO17 transposase
MTAATDSPGPAPALDLSAQDVVDLADELVAYHAEFSELFFRKEQQHWALKYLAGLVQPEAGKSVERLALRVPGGNVRNMQQFIGEGAWDDAAILCKHAALVGESLGEADGVVIVDGSDFPKKGKYSAGVARQYCGATGKVDNCQAAVFVAYASSKGHTLLDRRLYLPQEWFEASSQARRQRCQIPEGTRFRTKLELAWEMLEGLLAQGAVPFSWVLCDEAFGDSHEFLGHLEQAGLRYLADVSVSTLVWLERPATEVPRAKSTGRPPSRERVLAGEPAPIRVDRLMEQLPDSAWRTYTVKAGEKGPIRARFAFVRAVAARDGLPGPDLGVVFRHSLGEPRELKVFLSNAPAETPPAELVHHSGMRWPIESCFEEAKSNLGMAQYQTRSWRGWHHHMTLVILAHHYLVRVQLRHKKGHRR